LMQAVAVTEHFNVFEDCSSSLITCSEVLVIDQFIFWSAEEALGYSIVITVTTTTHARNQLMFIQGPR
jgi:hypothetical protein